MRAELNSRMKLNNKPDCKMSTNLINAITPIKTIGWLSVIRIAISPTNHARLYISQKHLLSNHRRERSRQQKTNLQIIFGGDNTSMVHSSHLTAVSKNPSSGHTCRNLSIIFGRPLKFIKTLNTLITTIISKKVRQLLTLGTRR